MVVRVKELTNEEKAERIALLEGNYIISPSTSFEEFSKLLDGLDEKELINVFEKYLSKRDELRKKHDETLEKIILLKKSIE